MINIIANIILIYQIVLFIRILMTWFPPITGTALYAFLAELTDPYLSIFRRLIPPAGGLDFSPIVAILVLEVIRRVLLSGVRF